MFVATCIISGLLAALLLVSAGGKFSKAPDVMKQMDHVGVPPNRVPVLATLETAGAVGVIAGLSWAPIGIAAAIGVVLYFVGAVIAHLRVGDSKQLAAPGVPLLFAVAALVFRIVTL